jgi:hypothetical protein
LGVHVGQRVVGRRGEHRASGFIELRFVLGDFSPGLFRFSGESRGFLLGGLAGGGELVDAALDLLPRHIFAFRVCVLVCLCVGLGVVCLGNIFSRIFSLRLVFFVL